MSNVRPRIHAVRCLIIDDDLEDRGRIVQALSKGFPGWELIEISSQREVDAALTLGNFDIVLTEYRLGWSDGLKILRAVRRRFPRRPVVWVSRIADPTVIAAAKRTGVNAYVAKSDLDSLLEAMQASLASAKLVATGQPAHERVEVADDRYRVLCELTADYAYALHVTKEGDLVYEWVSDDFTHMTGYTLDELIQAGDWTCLIHPDDESLAQQRRERWLASQSDICEWRIRTRSGQELWLHDRARPVYERARRRVVRIYGAGQDITQRKRDEELAHQAQKMEAIGRLAGGIAHDFNNLLQVITGYSDMLLKRLTRQKPLRQYVQQIRNVAEQGAIITRQLMLISRMQPLQPQAMDLRRIINSIIPMLQRLLGGDIELATVLDPALGRVNADPGQLEQVILNIAVNARATMPQGGRLRLEATNIGISRSAATRLAGIGPGPYIRLTVQDTGSGMDADVQSHIFEPFFTTNEPGKGTGLGLFTAYGIISQNGGHMTVESAPNVGTTFIIYLPRVGESIPEAVTETGPQIIALGGETILLVEDEAVVRDLVREILQGNGYTVVEAATGEEALPVCAQHTGPLHLLLADVVLPGMSGPDLAKQLVPTRPHLQVLFMSGHAPDTIAHHGGLDRQGPFLQKPFTPDGLLSLVRQSLDAAPAPKP